jgi:hypothetical protein
MKLLIHATAAASSQVDRIDPIPCSFIVKFRDPIHHVLGQNRLNRAFILGRDVLRNARRNKAGAGRLAENLGDPLRQVAVPVRADQQ